MYSRVITTSDTDKAPVFLSKAPIYDKEELALLDWEEHCVECSPPYCYNNCENYISRIDRKCVRLKGGIIKVDSINGPLGYGVKCIFRKWAKLETKWSGLLLPISENIKKDEKWHNAGNFFMGIASYLKLISPTLKPYGAYIKYRNDWFKGLNHSYLQPNIFYINCYLVDKDEVPLMIQIDNHEKIFLTKIEKLKKGENCISINIDFQIPLGARIFVTPLDESDTTIYFRWLDIFKGSIPIDEQPAPKVKVVAWDLDNTLWHGILVNDNGVILNQNAVDVLKELDKRGILNTIVSKNDESNAMQMIESLGLKDYFLYPAINWGQKSENIKVIAKHLNLGINSFAFIDDNVRERDEVSQSLPCVRVFADTEIDTLLNRNEFDVPITETSQKRRLLYMEDAKRVSIKEKFGDDYDGFLRSLEMKLIKEPIIDDNRSRCFELLSRSNQLNLSTNRYNDAEYEALLKNESMLCRAIRVSDKYGDYGVVAFVSVRIDGCTAYINDLVISCRIAKKKVEKAIIISIKDDLQRRNVNTLNANLIITKKNSPLVEVFSQLPFDIVEKDNCHILYSIKEISILNDDGIIKLEER